MKILVLLLGCASGLFARDAEDISSILEPIREKHSLPGLAAAVFDTSAITAQGAVGVRKTGEAQKVEIGDLWHLGSDTKAITATLAGTFVADGSLRWDDTVSKHFPAFAAQIDPKLKDVTIADLLANRAGLKPNLNWGSFGRVDLPAARQEAARRLLTAPPDSPVGDFSYSNAGFVVAGALLENVGKQSWEELVTKRIFEPLGMKDAGFGGTGTLGKIDQPWPHLLSGEPTRSNGPNVDNHPVLGPAGTCHASMDSWARFLADQLRGGAGKKALLPGRIYETLQKPYADDKGYALGWGTSMQPWAGGKVLSHAGSNTMNFAVCWVAVPAEFGILVCTNQAGPEATKGADEVFAALKEWQAKKKRR